MMLIKPLPLVILASGIIALGNTLAAEQETGFIDQSGSLPFNRDSLSIGGDGLGGIAWADFNNDGREDLFLTNGIGGQNALFINRKKGFTDIASTAGVASGEGASAVIAVDFNGDGNTDILTLGDGGWTHAVADTQLHLYKNNGDGTFDDVIGESGLLPFLDSSMSASVADIDQDGDLDLFISSFGSFALQQRQQSHLYKNKGNFIFEDITQSAGIISDQGACVSGFSDYDNDHDVDLFIGNCNDIEFEKTPIQLFRNNGNSQFTDVTEESGLQEVKGFWMGFAFGDFNNDNHIDLFATNAGVVEFIPQFESSPQALVINNGDGTFTNVAESAKVANYQFGWGAVAQDFDNDGWLDIFYAGNINFNLLLNEEFGNPGHLFLNRGYETLTFNDSPNLLPFPLSTSFVSSIASADYDQDGRMDIAMIREAVEIGNNETTSGQAILWKNTLDDEQWLQVRLIGHHLNPTAIGAHVTLRFHDGSSAAREVYAGTSLGATETAILHFGLGDKKPKSLEVRWPTGEVTQHKVRKTNKRLKIALKYPPHSHRAKP